MPSDLAPAPTTPAPSHPPVSARAARLPALDALRGLAIALVLGYHFAPQSLVADPVERAVRATLQAGWVGVDLFLVLSGFLITGILLDGAREPGALVRFYGRRALRILPLYYGTLGVLLLVALSLEARGTASSASATLLRDQAWYWLHGANLAAARSTQWIDSSWVQHFWSLAVEEQFYLLWPAVVLLLPRRRLPQAIALLCAGAFATRVVLVLVAEHKVGAYVLTTARADALAMGAMLALAWRTPAWHAATTRAAAQAVPLMGAALLAIMLAYGSRAHLLMMATIGHSYWALLFAALLWLAIAPATDAVGPVARGARGWQRWLARQRWLHLLSRYSYGLYVVHYPLRAWLEHHGLVTTDLVRVWGFWAGTVAGIALGAGVSLAVAVPLWHLFEEPILHRGGAWLDGRYRPAAAHAPSAITATGGAAGGPSGAPANA